MKVSVQLFASCQDGEAPAGIIEETLELTRLADELGFATIWFAEHHGTPWNLCTDPLTLAAYAAGVTRSIGLGTAVSNLTVQHPLAVAERGALVAHLSGGRLQLGVGRGFVSGDLALFGVSQDTASQVFDHNLGLFGAHAARLIPAGQGLWLATTGNPGTLGFAAEHGWGLLLAGGGGRLDEIGSESRLLWQRGQTGVQPMAVFRAVHVADTVEQARAEMLPHVTWYRDQAALLQPEQAVRPVDEVLASFCVFGPPQACLSELASLAQTAGATEVVAVFGLGAAPLAMTRQSMRRFAAEVMPQLAEPNPTDARMGAMK
jgi:alkanesulfonate monooxygenase SsuD/methylene tetrahydromethanopterin reductase-like flavin-dependent oxidoreductase (luciferase family)